MNRQALGMLAQLCADVACLRHRLAQATHYADARAVARLTLDLRRAEQALRASPVWSTP